jgi:hypothetical protein
MNTPETTDQPAPAVASSDWFGELIEKQRAEQLGINCRWLIEKIDRIHRALCRGQYGTWQQRVEQAVEAAERLSPNDQVERQPPPPTR